MLTSLFVLRTNLVHLPLVRFYDSSKRIAVTSRTKSARSESLSMLSSRMRVLMASPDSSTFCRTGNHHYFPYAHTRTGAVQNRTPQFKSTDGYGRCYCVPLPSLRPPGCRMGAPFLYPLIARGERYDETVPTVLANISIVFLSSYD